MSAVTNTSNAVNASNTQIVRWVFITIIISAVLVGAWLIRDILMLTLTAVIVAVLLTTPVRFFVTRGLSRPLAVLLSAGLIVTGLTIVVLLILPDLFSQFRTLASTYIPQASTRLQEQLRPDNLRTALPFLKDVSNEEIQAAVNQASQQILGGLANFSIQLFPFVSGLLSTILSILVVVFLALYFVADPNMHTRGIVRLFPVRNRERVQEILVSLDLALRNFLEAQVVLMVLIGVSTAIMLAVMGVPLAGALGTITGLFSFVPNFGPLVALVPILAVGIINTPEQIGVVIVVFYVLQFVQSQIVTPLLMSQEINLPPAMILLSQIVAGIFFGFLGLLLSVPLAAIVVVLVREVYIRDILGDRELDEKGMPKPPVPEKEPARAT